MKIFRLFLLTVVLASPSLTQAQDVKSRTFSLETQKSMTKAMEYIEEQKYSKAEKKLKDVRKIKGLSSYELSTVEQMLGQVTYQEKDFKDAIRHFQNAVKAGGLLPNEATGLELTIAQLLITTKQYEAGAMGMENWLRKTGRQDVKYLEAVVQAWVEAEKYDHALPWAERWFAVKAPKERKHYDLMNFLYHSMGQSNKQLAVLQSMTAQWPQERKLWDFQISALAAQNRTQEAYQVFAKLYDLGLLSTKSDLSKLVQYHEYYKRFDLAARVLETEMNKGRLDGGETNLAKLTQLKRQAGIAP